MAQSDEITLIVDDYIFKATKEMLCEHSDYFRAMFSGNYIENEKKEISINVVEHRSMEIILRYMKTGLIDLSEYPLATIGELAIAANFLQITELMKQIEYCLGLQLTLSNWVETMCIAENASYKKLEDHCAAYALFSFKQMKPEYIKSVHKLGWWLSHSHLSADCEIDVFEFGLKWVMLKESGADTILHILGCLDMTRITKGELCYMKKLMRDYENSLAEKVVDCLHKLATDFAIYVEAIKKNKTALCEMYTERVYKEVLDLVSNSTKRELKYKPIVSLNITSEDPYQGAPGSPHHLYSFTEENGFSKYLEVANKELWGWNVVSWGPTKLIIVGGEHGRGTGFFWKDVKVYDILTKEWTQHGVTLPVRRHGGVAVLEDSLFLIGGVGGFRVMLDSAIIYDLKRRSHRQIARLPDAIQSPAVCVHNGQVYASGHKNIYRYEDWGQTDTWTRVMETNIRPGCFVSFKGYIYCTQNYFTNFYRFRPNVDAQLEAVTYFSNPPAAIVSLGNRLIAFTNSNGTQAEIITAEEYKQDETPKVLWTKSTSTFTVNDVAGCCALVDSAPPLRPNLSPYLKRHLANYDACYSN